MRTIGLSATDFRVISDQISGYQRPNHRVISDRPFGLLATNPPKLLRQSKAFQPVSTGVTRARDLNSLFNSVTYHPRLLGGSAPCPLKPPHPAYPHKERPSPE